MPGLTLMAVHAHPDDESSSTGGVFARYCDEGIKTVLVTCTNGEYGDGPEPREARRRRSRPAAGRKTRLAELDVAVQSSASRTSNCSGTTTPAWPTGGSRTTTDAFAVVPFEESTGKLVELFEAYRPDVVITYHDNGGYNHPDHLQAHRITVAACERTGIPSKLYFIARRRRDWQKMREALPALGIDIPTPLQNMDDEQRKQWESAWLRSRSSSPRPSTRSRSRAQARRARRPRQPARRVVVGEDADGVVRRRVRRGDVHPRLRPHRCAGPRDRPVRRPALTTARSQWT